MTSIVIAEKRVFWRRVLIVAVLVVSVCLLMMVGLYLSGMSEAKVSVGEASDLELDIAEVSARYRVIARAARWAVPGAIFGSFLLNLARFRLRKLKKLEAEASES